MLINQYRHERPQLARESRISLEGQQRIIAQPPNPRFAAPGRISFGAMVPAC
jgi:hypothetical protein